MIEKTNPKFQLKSCFTLFVPIIFLLSGCSGDNRGPAHFAGNNILLISIDTCRADYLEPFGGTKIETPHINALAEDSSIFTDAVTPVPLTLPAHASLLSGLHPIQHNVRDNFGGVLSEMVVTLPELFQESGYTTAGVIGTILISRRTGLNQGFDMYNDEFSRAAFRALQPSVERKAETVNDLTMEWLESYLQPEAEPKQPFFLFTHYYDPHMLYQPPEPYDELYKNDLYGGEIAYVDHHIGELMTYLKDNGLYDDMLIVLVGDHGEGLGDHQEITHGLFLYEECVHVPFLIKLPKREGSAGGHPIEQSASLEDVAPTLMELCGLGFTQTNGTSLVPWLLEGKEAEERWICLETQYPLTFNWSPMYSLRSSDWKYIHTPRPELYNLYEDSEEKKNIIDQASAQTKHMNSILEDRLVDMAQTAMVDNNPQYSMERVEILTSLGYVAAGNTRGRIGPDKTLPDAKDKISIYVKNDVGLAELKKKNYKRAIELFRQVMENDPTNPTAYFNLGLAYMELGDMENALSHMEQAVLLAPENIHIHLYIAKVLVQKGETEKGQKVLESIIEEKPQMADAHFQLGWLELDAENYESALRHFEEAQKWMPDMPDLDAMMERAKKGLSQVNPNP